MCVECREGLTLNYKSARIGTPLVFLSYNLFSYAKSRKKKPHAEWQSVIAYIREMIVIFKISGAHNILCDSIQISSCMVYGVCYEWHIPWRCAWLLPCGACINSTFINLKSDEDVFSRFLLLVVVCHISRSRFPTNLWPFMRIVLMKYNVATSQWVFYIIYSFKAT